MIAEYFIYLGAIASFIGGFAYLRDTISGKAKPNKVTWLLWTIIPFIAVAAQIKEGVGLPTLMTFMVGFTPLLIFIASFFNKKSQWKLGKFDLICGGLSILGVMLWIVTKDANLAILFSIIADGLAALPTIRKAFYNPETESENVYLGAIVAGALTILALKNYNLANLGFPLYILILNIFLVLLIKFKLGRRLVSLVS